MDVTYFEGQGRGTAEDDDALFAGHRAAIYGGELSGAHTKRPSLDFELVRLLKE